MLATNDMASWKMAREIAQGMVDSNLARKGAALASYLCLGDGGRSRVGQALGEFCPHYRPVGSRCFLCRIERSSRPVCRYCFEMKSLPTEIWCQSCKDDICNVTPERDKAIRIMGKIKDMLMLEIDDDDWLKLLKAIEEML